jgi:hypothetical protein
MLRDLVRGYRVLPKVQVSELIDETQPLECPLEDFERVRSKYLDFVICDAEYCPIVAIELERASDKAESRRQRNGLIDRSLAAVSFPILRLRAEREYQSEEAMEKLIGEIEPFLANRPPTGPAFA